uniref:Ig-like domain-containing protein n=1 Tax=Labrus bergylta TaxID=56723 RepID=A0A3Q3EPB2_9LABR
LIESVLIILSSLFLLLNSNHYNPEEVTSCGKLKVLPSFEPLFTRKLDVLEVIEGRNARFDCKVSGTPAPKVIWSHFGKFVLLSRIEKGCHFTFVYDDNECSLVVLNARPEDSGVYTCTARNLAGSVSCKAELTIHEGKRSLLSEEGDEEES